MQRRSRSIWRADVAKVYITLARYLYFGELMNIVGLENSEDHSIIGCMALI
jgi:hypothetical protein